MNPFDNFGFQFTGKHSPSWLLEMFSHPFLLIICIMTIGLGYAELSRKLKNGDIKLNNKSLNIIVLVGALLMMIIATR